MRKRKKAIECANCHHSFTEINNYCPNCGQENHTHKLPVGHFAMELLESLTHFDTKIYTTFKEMVTKPGLVAKNYNNNKRARYVPPIRIYVFMSFVFFFLIAILYNSTVHENTVKLQEAFKKDFAPASGKGSFINIGDKTKIDSTIFYKLIAEEHITNDKIDSILLLNKSKTNWINTRILHTFIKLYKGETSVDEIYNKLVKYISYALLIFMPFFALVLKIFYRKKQQYYSEFLVFSLYFHTFIFAAFALLLIFTKYIYSSSFLYLGFAIGAVVYLGFSLKRVFEDSILKTSLKTSLIAFIYFISMTFLIMMMLVGSLL
jgi:hypothetical protein